MGSTPADGPVRPLPAVPFAVPLAFGTTALALTVVVVVAGIPLPVDESLIRLTQRQEWRAGPATFVNHLTSAPSWLAWASPALAASGFARRAGGREPARAALVVLALAVLLRSGSPLLKALIESPRPDPSYGVRVTEVRDSFGFPSGHVYSAVLVYGAVAWALAHTWGRRIQPAIWGVAVAIMVAAGPARVYVGAHWPSDVAGGYLWGATALSLALLAGRSVHPGRVRPRATPPAGSGL